MESDDKPQLHDLIWLRKPLPQNAGMIQDLGSRADVVTCGTVSCQRKPLWVAGFPPRQDSKHHRRPPLDAAGDLDRGKIYWESLVIIQGSY